MPDFLEAFLPDPLDLHEVLNSLIGTILFSECHDPFRNRWSYSRQRLKLFRRSSVDVNEFLLLCIHSLRCQYKREKNDDAGQKKQCFIQMMLTHSYSPLMRGRHFRLRTLRRIRAAYAARSLNVSRNLILFRRSLIIDIYLNVNESPPFLSGKRAGGRIPSSRIARLAFAAGIPQAPFQSQHCCRRNSNIDTISGASVMNSINVVFQLIM